ncbi:hypothetical protein D9757_012660 [Collybiopsis confluens]|uniref:Uncharacterized protein n=1 Tax=Collybiopsis confluens TaxID=2823264 RepID=A0A8H5D4P4_9AGAR|nr:hypothetical protein D9757_012660 [Collybiopsis confluens]
MSGPPPEDYGDYPGSKGPSPRHRQSAPPIASTVVYDGAFFSGAHDFKIFGGEYSTAQTVHKTVTNDSSYRSNFNNQRTEDHRGTARLRTISRVNLVYDNRQLRSQKYNASYNDIGQYGSGRGRGRPQYGPYVEDHDDEDDEYYGARSSYSWGGRGRSGGFGNGPGYRRRRRWDYDDDEYDEEYDGDRRNASNEPPRMLESREAVRQRERATFDSTYSAPNTSRNSRGGSVDGVYQDVRAEREREVEAMSYSQTFQQEPQSYAYRAEPEPQYSAGPGPGPGFSSEKFASPAPGPATSRFNPFRSSTAPIPGPGNFSPPANTRPPPNRWGHRIVDDHQQV